MLGEINRNGSGGVGRMICRGLFLSVLLLAAGCDQSTVRNWPEVGKLKVEKIISIPDVELDCYSSAWASEHRAEIGAISNIRVLGNNKECTFSSSPILWTSFEDVVNATFRCQSDGIVGEYTLQVFRDNDTKYGDYYCNSAHFPDSQKYPVGAVTDLMKTPY